MSKKQLLEEVITESQSAPSTPCIGRLAGTNAQRDILVEFEGKGPFAARLTAGVERSKLMKAENRAREVLLVFEKGDIRRPIIIALMEDPLENLVTFELPAEDKPEADDPRDLRVDGKRITIEAEDEIMLKCGQGSILIRNDGKIIVKGTDLLSRSSGRQRIRGASVTIN